MSGGRGMEAHHRMNEFDQRLSRIVRHAYDNAPGFRAIMDEAGVRPDEVGGIDDLPRIPITPKDRLILLQQESPPFGGFLAAPASRLTHIFLSPGPLYEPAIEDEGLIRATQSVFTQAGLESGDVVLNTFSYHLVPAGMLADRVLRRIGATVIPAGVGNADLQLKMLRDLRVTGYVGTPSWLMALLQAAEQAGLNAREDLALRKALLSAEPLPPSLRRAFVEVYGLRVTNAYGTAELGLLAYGTEGGLSMRLVDSAVIEVADPDTGRPVAPGDVGEVVVTTFDETYPLIRFGTGDLAMNLDPAPGASRQGERSVILVGRLGDAVKVRGLFVHPNQLTHALGGFPSVAAFQATARRPEHRDEFCLKLVLADPGADRAALEAGVQEAVKQACRVSVDGIEFVESLPADAPKIVDARRWE